MGKFRLPLPKKEILYNSVKTDLGWLSFAVSAKGLLQTKFMFDDKESAERSLLENGQKSLLETDLGFIFDKEDKLLKWKKLFVKYFKGKITDVSCVPLDNRNWSSFQKKVYSKTIQIPFGKKITYGSIASLINNPKASRAIGMAMRVNPVAPVVPCHRVVGANNIHYGFSANGGVDLKVKMLEIEKNNS